MDTVWLKALKFLLEVYYKQSSSLNHALTHMTWPVDNDLCQRRYLKSCLDVADPGLKAYILQGQPRTTEIHDSFCPE